MSAERPMMLTRILHDKAATQSRVPVSLYRCKNLPCCLGLGNRLVDVCRVAASERTEDDDDLPRTMWWKMPIRVEKDQLRTFSLRRSKLARDQFLRVGGHFEDSALLLFRVFSCFVRLANDQKDCLLYANARQSHKREKERRARCRTAERSETFGESISSDHECHLTYWILVKELCDEVLRASRAN